MCEKGYFAVDIGSMNSLVAYKDSDSSIAVALNQSGKRQTPTIFLKTKEQRFFGNLAKSYKDNHPFSTLEQIKKFIGINNNHETRKYLRNFTQIKLVKHSDFVQFSIDDNCYTMEEILAFVIIELASLIPKPNCSQIAVVVPAIWSNVERQVIVNAIKIAGFDLVKLVNSSVAQAADYLYRNSMEEGIKKYGCFVDCGHSSFIISFIQITKNEIKLLASHQVDCGGYHFTKKLKKFILNKVTEDDIYQFNKDKCERILGDYSLNSRFTESVQKTKESLTAGNFAIFDFIGNTPDQDIKNFIVKREDFEKASEKLFQKIENCSRDCYDKARRKINENKIEVLEIHGGSGRIPKIRDILTKIIKVESTQFLNAEECIVEGAVYASAFDTIKINQHHFNDLGMRKKEPPENVMTDEEIAFFRDKMQKEREKELKIIEIDNAHQQLQNIALSIKKLLKRNELHLADNHSVKKLLRELSEEFARVHEESGDICDVALYNDISGWWESLTAPLIHFLVLVSYSGTTEPNCYAYPVLCSAYEKACKSFENVIKELDSRRPAKAKDDFNIYSSKFASMSISEARMTGSVKRVHPKKKVSPVETVIESHYQNMSMIYGKLKGLANDAGIKDMMKLIKGATPLGFYDAHIGHIDM